MHCLTADNFSFRRNCEAKIITKGCTCIHVHIFHKHSTCACDLSAYSRSLNFYSVKEEKFLKVCKHFIASLNVWIVNIWSAMQTARVARYPKLDNLSFANLKNGELRDSAPIKKTWRSHSECGNFTKSCYSGKHFLKLEKILICVQHVVND